MSVVFERAAERLLDRAYAKRGEWVSVRLTDPTIRDRTRWAAEGINVGDPDPVTGNMAKTRWARALVRALYRAKLADRRGGALKFEVGRHIPASPQFDPRNPRAGGFPPSRQFRVKIDRGGRTALRAVQRLPDSRRIYDDRGQPAGRWGGGDRFRDWA